MTNDIAETRIRRGFSRGHVIFHTIVWIYLAVQGLHITPNSFMDIPDFSS